MKKGFKHLCSLIALVLLMPTAKANGIVTITFGRIAAVDFADLKTKTRSGLKGVTFRGDFSVDGDSSFSEHPDSVRLVYKKTSASKVAAIASCLKKGLTHGRVYMNFSTDRVAKKSSDSFSREYTIDLDDKNITDFGCEEFVVARSAFQTRRYKMVQNFNDYVGTIRLRHAAQSHRSFSLD